MITEMVSGRCTCAEVAYQFQPPPLIVHCCHCRWCQRETGSAFVINALIETSRIALLSGQPDSVETPSESGKGQHIIRCPSCRVALWSHYAGMGQGVAFVRVGTLDNPDLFPPDIHIFTESRQPWVRLPDTIPVRQRYYRREEVWPEASMERWVNTTRAQRAPP
ncbi:MAG: GFA family protein [Xanthomonadales bacterium]|nr:GFA family protein [Xanthomonadales bacterium]